MERRMKKEDKVEYDALRFVQRIRLKDKKKE